MELSCINGDFYGRSKSTQHYHHHHHWYISEKFVWDQKPTREYFFLHLGRSQGLLLWIWCNGQPPFLYTGSNEVWIDFGQNGHHLSVKQLLFNSISKNLRLCSMSWDLKYIKTYVWESPPWMPEAKLDLVWIIRPLMCSVSRGRGWGFLDKD